MSISCDVNLTLQYLQLLHGHLITIIASRTAQHYLGVYIQNIASQVARSAEATASSGANTISSMFTSEDNNMAQ